MFARLFDFMPIDSVGEAEILILEDRDTPRVDSFERLKAEGCQRRFDDVQ